MEQVQKEPGLEPRDATENEEAEAAEMVEAELLVEDVSIDGMCGVY
jgi:mycofactocin precursor